MTDISCKKLRWYDHFADFYDAPLCVYVKQYQMYTKAWVATFVAIMWKKYILT
jgi:hypothetical protein